MNGTICLAVFSIKNESSIFKYEIIDNYFPANLSTWPTSCRDINRGELLQHIFAGDHVVLPRRLQKRLELNFISIEARADFDRCLWIGTRRDAVAVADKLYSQRFN